MDEKIKKLLENKDFVEKIFLKDEKTIKEAFKNEKTEISDEDIATIKKFHNEVFNEISKINENELEEISGGLFENIKKLIHYTYIYNRDGEIPVSELTQTTPTTAPASSDGSTAGGESLKNVGAVIGTTALTTAAIIGAERLVRYYRRHKS